MAVYLAALELGSSNMQDLALKSGVKRTSIYNFINELRERGLIVETKKKGRRVYSAVGPEQLLALEKARAQELERLMPELRAIQNSVEQKPKVTFYEGIQNVLAVYEDQLSDAKPIIAYEDLEYMQEAMPKNFYNEWPARRAAKKIPFRSILRDSADARSFIKNNVQLLRQSKLVAADPWRTEINIYGDKVACMRFSEKGALCVVIEDPDIAQTLRFGWEQLWEKL